jgi:hypothetical protein
VTWDADTVGSMRRHRCALLLGVLLASSACERTHDLLLAADAGDAGGDGGGDDAQADAGEPPYHVDAGVYLCGDKVCACSDGRDNEPVPDSYIDGFDPECTGPYDNDEATFATGEKEGNPRCIDCFFDGDPTSSNDGCQIPTSCRDEGNNSGAFGMCDGCTPSAECVTNCIDRTPNGCDCFGCCQIEDGSQTRLIQLADTCSMAVLSDESKCPTCFPNMNYDEATSGGPCFNPCGPCELCPGRTADELDDECLTYVCEDAEVCGASNELCPDRAWCIQGCCAPILL